MTRLWQNDAQSPQSGRGFMAAVALDLVLFALALVLLALR